MNKLRRELARLLVNAFIKGKVCTLPFFLQRRIVRFWNYSNRMVETARAHPSVGAEVDPRLHILDLFCTSGYGQTVHPCARYIQDGFGAGGWRYLLTLTGFPNSHDYFENPELLVSHDGVHWQLPDGGGSPVVPPPMDWLGYNSDPFLFVEDGTLHLVYRRFLDGAEPVVSLLLLQSSDGVIWSEPSQLLEKRGEGMLMSPSLLRSSQNYFMWYVDRIAEGRYEVCRAVSHDLKSWNIGEHVVINGLCAEEEPWHLEIVRLKETSTKLTMLLTTFDRREPQVKRLVLMDSNDDGVTWQATGARLHAEDLAGKPESLYKSSILVGRDESHSIYISLKRKDGSWWTGMGKFVHETILGEEG